MDLGGHLMAARGPLAPRANIRGKGAIGPFLDQSLETRRWSPTDEHGGCPLHSG